MKTNVQILVASLLLSLASLQATGQVIIRPQVGVNFPEFTKEIVGLEFKGNTGYQFGADVQFGSRIYLQAGLNFQTTKLSLTNSGDMTISRINVPIMIGNRLLDQNDGSSIGLRIFVGPNFAYHANTKLNDLPHFDDEEINEFHMSGLAGAGVDIGILFLDAGYNFGLSKLFDEDIIDKGSLGMWMVNAGIRL